MFNIILKVYIECINNVCNDLILNKKKTNIWKKMKWLSAQNTLNALVHKKSDDKKKDKNSTKKRRLQDSFHWLYSS